MPSPSTLIARLVGYSVVFVFLGGMIGIAVFAVRDSMSMAPQVQVEFEEMSTLGVGDPVVLNGVAIGKIESIELKADRAVTRLRFFSHRSFASDTRFYNISHSLMGARKVWVVPGNSTEDLDLTQKHSGVFVPGLPETLHKVDGLVARVAHLREEAEGMFIEASMSPQPGALAQGRAAGPMKAFASLENAHAGMARLSEALAQADLLLRQAVAVLSSAAEGGMTATAFIREGAPATDSALARAEQFHVMLAASEGPLNEALTLLESLNKLAADSSGAGRFLSDDREYGRLVATHRALDSLTKALRKGGLGDEMKINAGLKKRKP
jgi:ABC-type transporter Mla subunit MlaD